MAYFGMSKNGSGIKDETAYKAFCGMAKPGDIWEAGNGRERVLILKNQGSYCNCLTVLDKDMHDQCIEINSAGTMYTNPGMVKYLFFDRLGAFVQRLPATEFDKVLQAVEDALNFRSSKKVDKSRQDMHELLDRIIDRVEAR